MHWSRCDLTVWVYNNGWLQNSNRPHRCESPAADADAFCDDEPAKKHDERTRHLGQTTETGYKNSTEATRTTTATS